MLSPRVMGVSAFPRHARVWGARVLAVGFVVAMWVWHQHPPRLAGGQRGAVEYSTTAATVFVNTDTRLVAEYEEATCPVVTAELMVTEPRFIHVDKKAIATYLDTTRYLELLRYLIPLNDNYGRFWYHFGGLLVWLPEQQLHYVVHRVMFTPNGDRSHGKVLVVYAQVYDAEWNEVVGHQWSLPRAALKSLAANGVDDQVRAFPHVVPIPFSVEKAQHSIGPEDPRVVLRQNPLGFAEPMIIFNMLHFKHRVVENKRLITLYFPFTHTQVPLRIYGYLPLVHEKNWTPYFDEETPVGGHTEVRFVYSWNPVQVLACSLETGWCRFVQGTATLDENDRGLDELDELAVSNMRGGTPLVSVLAVPRLARLEQQLGMKLWVSFARAHLARCGCGTDMYRPNLVVMGRRESRVVVVGVLLFVEMGKLTQWYLEPYGACDGVNAVIPNGIASWDKEDVMGVMLLSGDMNVQLVWVRGVAQVVEQVVGQWKAGVGHDGFSTAMSCALSRSRERCRVYGKQMGNLVLENLVMVES